VFTTTPVAVSNNPFGGIMDAHPVRTGQSLP
jgi:hypothetical protein